MPSKQQSIAGSSQTGAKWEAVWSITGKSTIVRHRIETSMVNLEAENREVKEMLDEICPVQFVEGLNEGADLSDVESVVITYYSSVGLQYIPKVSYSLTRLEIMLTFGDFLEGAQIRVELCSDYEDKPMSASLYCRISYADSHCSLVCERKVITRFKVDTWLFNPVILLGKSY